MLPILRKIKGACTRRTSYWKNIAGGQSNTGIAVTFRLEYVTLEPSGGQVPWHNQEQEEIYFILEVTGEMCLGNERTEVRTGQAVDTLQSFYYITNTGSQPMIMIYYYGPAGDVAHWRQESTALCRERVLTRAARGRHSSAHKHELSIAMTNSFASILTALVTGALRGIRRECAIALSKSGFNVLLNDLPIADNALLSQRLVVEIGDSGAESMFFGCDVADLAQHTKLVKQRRRPGEKLIVLLTMPGSVLFNVAISWRLRARVLIAASA